MGCVHDDVIKWKHFPRYWPFVRGIHWSPVNSPHKGQRRGALTFSLICAWINGWINNREAGDLRRNRAHYDVIVMYWIYMWLVNKPMLEFVIYTTIATPDVLNMTPRAVLSYHMSVIGVVNPFTACIHCNLRSFKLLWQCVISRNITIA